MSNLLKTKERPKNKTPYHWLVAVSTGIVVFVTIGMEQNAVGILIPAIADHFSIGRGEASAYISFQGYVLMAAYFFAGKVMSRFSGRVWMPAAAILAATGFIGISLAENYSYFYVFAVLIALSLSMIGGLFSGVIVNNWFRDKAGTVLGATTIFASLGGVLWNPIGSVVINQFGWAWGYRAIGIVLLVVILPLTLFVIRYKPEDKGLLPYGASPDETEAEAGIKEVPGITGPRALRSSAFWLIILFTVFGTVVTSFNTALPGFALSLNEGVAVSGFVSSAALLGGMIGKGIIGVLIDKWGSKVATTVVVILGLLGSATIYFQMNTAMFIVGCFVLGLSFGLVLVQAVMCVRQSFGMRSFGVISGWVSAARAAAYYSTVSVYGFIYDATGSYFSGLILVVVSLIVCAILMRLIQKTAVRLKEEF